MTPDIVVLTVAFIAGMASILTPCVLPLLPAILAASSTGAADRGRQYGIVVGLVGSFMLAVLLFSLAVQAFNLPSNSLRWVATIILAVVGLMLLVPRLRHAFESAVSRLSSHAPQADRSRSGFGGGVLIGSGLGLVWAPCAGPILVGVTVAGTSTAVSLDIIPIAIALGLGMTLPLLAITLGGRRMGLWLKSRLDGQRVTIFMGIILLATAVYISGNFDTQVNSYLARTIGFTSTPTAGLEKRALESHSADTASIQEVTGTDAIEMQPVTNIDPAILADSGYPENTSDGLFNLGQAPALKSEEKWFNSQPLTLEALTGKVVLVDFWTYSCINCIRTLPYLTAWHDRYADDGLVIIGVHTPEFEFEKVAGNVQTAIRDFGIQYPVVQDNNFATWRNYHNRYWPAKYLIDRDGNIRYVHPYYWGRPSVLLG